MTGYSTVNSFRAQPFSQPYHPHKSSNIKPMMLAGLFDKVRGIGYVPLTVQLYSAEPSEINAKDSKGNTPLMVAASLGQRSDVSVFLENSQTDINSTNREGETALHIAMKRGFSGIVIDLIKAGANLLVMNNEGKSPITIALKRYQKKISTKNITILNEILQQLNQPIIFPEHSPKGQQELVDSFNILLRSPKLLKTPIEINVGQSIFKLHLPEQGNAKLTTTSDVEWEADRLNKMALFSHQDHQFIVISTLGQKTHYIDLKRGKILSVINSTGVKLFGGKAIVAQYDFVLDKWSREIGKTHFYNLLTQTTVKDDRLLMIIRMHYTQTPSLDIFSRD